MIFANDRFGPDSAYLRDLVTERRRIEEALDSTVKRGQCRLEIDFNVTHDRFFDDLTEHHGDIVGVHFAGHADPSGLQFEDAHGRRVPARMSGIAQALAGLPALRWVFLNGCGTATHVETLQAYLGTPLVITEHAIADAAAAGFARRFYHALGHGRSLREAFDLADSELKSQCGAPLESVRAKADRMRMLQPAETADVDWPWVLAVPDDHPERAEWRLVLPHSATSLPPAAAPDGATHLATAQDRSTGSSPMATSAAPHAVAPSPFSGPPLSGSPVGGGVSDGICPACEAEGPVGTPCETERCRRFGCHRIPAVFIDDRGPLPDPLCGQLWGDYLLVSRLGQGGVGAVYLALQQPVGLRTALKVLHARHASGVLAERFAAEAQALARLIHPNIVRLLGSGTAGDRAYIVMEYIDGDRSLADAMAAGLDRPAARRILLQMVDALASAHGVGLVHRDIKPANVMLQSTGREPYFVRIVDFGLAKFTDDGHNTELAAGTPIYMAPEQIRRTGIGPWTDWYALGVLTCELLLGRRPFPSVTSRELVRLKVADALDPLAEFADVDLPPAVRRLLARALAFEPRERPQSADAMAALIEAAFESMPVYEPLASVEPSPVDGPSIADSDPDGAGGAAPPAATRRQLRWGLAAALVAAVVGGGWLFAHLAGPARSSASSGFDGRAPDTLPLPAPVDTGPVVVDAWRGGLVGVIDATTVDGSADAAAADAAAPDTAPPPARPDTHRRSSRGRARRRLPEREPAPPPDPPPAPEIQPLDIEVL